MMYISLHCLCHSMNFLNNTRIFTQKSQSANCYSIIINCFANDNISEIVQLQDCNILNNGMLTENMLLLATVLIVMSVRCHIAWLSLLTAGMIEHAQLCPPQNGTFLFS